MSTIRKYPVSPYFMTEVPTQKGGKILDIQLQDGEAMVWILVDENARAANRKIIPLMTGAYYKSINPKRYIKTVLFDEGKFVAHFFDGEE